MNWKAPDILDDLAHVTRAEKARDRLADEEYKLHCAMLEKIEAIEVALTGSRLAHIAGNDWPAILDTHVAFDKTVGELKHDGYRGGDADLAKTSTIIYNAAEIGRDEPHYAALPSLEIAIWDNTLNVIAHYGNENNTMAMRRAERLMAFHAAICDRFLQKITDATLKERILANNNEKISLIQFLIQDDRLHNDSHEEDAPFITAQNRFTNMRQQDFDSLVRHTRRISINCNRLDNPDMDQDIAIAQRLIIGWVVACEPKLAAMVMTAFDNAKSLHDITNSPVCASMAQDDGNFNNPFSDLIHTLPKPVKSDCQNFQCKPTIC